MKRTVLPVLIGAVLVLMLSPTAQADSFLSITVAVSGGATMTQTFNSATNAISFSGTINNVSFGAVNLLGNQPGAPGGATSADSKFSMTNNNASNATITVGFASSNFSVPAGTPMNLSATQTTDAIISSVGLSQSFQAWGDGANGLTPGVGTGTVSTPLCTTAIAPPENSCSTSSPTGSFTRPGTMFGLNGIETITLGPGAQASADGSIAATSTQVPEPSSVLLLGTGMLFLAGRRLRRK